MSEPTPTLTDEQREELAGSLAAHARKSGPHDDGLPTLDVRCTCGWTHPDRFIKNNDLHRAHVADALAPLIARMVAEAEQRGRADERGRIAADVAEFCSDDSSIEWVLHVIETGGTP